jgi:predicted glycogen debranching enzyme
MSADSTQSPPGAARAAAGAITRPLRVGWRRGDTAEALLSREWLLCNGLGGYACGTVAGVLTRRYHSLLVAALPAPAGRTTMLNQLGETLHLADGTVVALGGLEPGNGPLLLPEALAEFRLDNGRPVWRFEQAGVTLEKQIVFTHHENTTRIAYRLLEGSAPARLVLEPAVDFRGHDDRVDRGSAPTDYAIAAGRNGVRIARTGGSLPPLHLTTRTAEGYVPFVPRPREVALLYRIEQARGYESRGSLQALGIFELQLAAGQGAVLTASTESWEIIHALDAAEAARLDDERRQRLLAEAHPQLRRGLGAELVLAADQFVISPHVRPRDEARLRAEGDDARTVIAGYHWFTDWGRDTMISLEGLTLLTGRATEGRDVLQTFAHHIRDGLIPNLFPEAKTEGLYHTADATLWFFHALERYEKAAGERETRRSLLPQLVEVAQKHFAGTRFGIGVDDGDGLLRQGADGYQLTWMDAKVGDWVVTPRRGKAVEINALFYNALRLLAGWLKEEEAGTWGPARELGLRAADVEARADRLQRTFNRRFWNAASHCLFDVVDAQDGAHAGGDDPSVRPNQLLAISLPHPVLDRARWESVLTVVREQLLTPFGLRSLSPGLPDYKPRYDGDLRARDAAYHQGTVWGWLIGPFVDAWLKTFPHDRAGARRFLVGLEKELSEACLGTISEIFDAEAPFNPRGCVAQAWSVAEAMRAIVASASD